VLQYLEEAYGLPYHYLGWSWCRLGCPRIPDDIGTDDFTDGTYLFPEGLAHYVRRHAVRPPTEFLEHVRANNYHVPKLRTPNNRLQRTGERLSAINHHKSLPDR
jgi:hypothetical protein